MKRSRGSFIHISILLGLVLGLLALTPVATARQDMTATIQDVLQKVVNEAFNQGNTDVIDQVFAQDYVSHPGEQNRDEFKQSILTIRTAMPDFTSQANDVLIEGNFVAFRFVGVGTFTAPYASPQGNTPPTGNPVTIALNIVIRFNDNGQAEEEWDGVDNFALLQQFGVMPGTPAAEITPEPTAETPSIAPSGKEDAHKTAATNFLSQLYDQKDTRVYNGVAADFVDHDPNGPSTVAADIAAAQVSFTALPDLQAKVEATVAEGDWVAVAFTLKGTFTGQLAYGSGSSFPGNGNSVNLLVVSFFHFNQDDQIDQIWEQYDQLSLVTQLGLMGPPPTPQS